MSVRALSLVWEKCEASGSELLVMLALADWADDHGYAFPSYEKLAQRARISIRSAMRIVSAFEKRGELERIRKGHKTPQPGHRPGKTGLQPRNLYRLTCMPAVAESSDTRGTSFRTDAAVSSVARVTSFKPRRSVTPDTALPAEEVTPLTGLPDGSSDTGGTKDVTPEVFRWDASLNDPSVDSSGTPTESVPPAARPGEMPHVALVGDHRMLYVATYGLDPKRPSNPEYANAARIVKRFGYPKALELLKAFFVSRDRFIHESDHEFLTFVRLVGKIVVEKSARPLPQRQAAASSDANVHRRQIRDANVRHVAQEDFHIVGPIGSPEAP